MSMLINPYIFGMAPPVNGYRFWRMLVSAGEGAYVGCAELKFNIGGVAQYGGTAAASTAFDSATQAGNAFDNNTATNWASNGSPFPQWVRYDYGPGVYKVIETVTIIARSFTGQGPKDFKIQGSNDGVNWVDRYTVTGAPTWGSLESRTYTLP